MKILVVPGDGIGPEIISASLTVVDAAARRVGLPLSYEYSDVGKTSLQKHGVTIRDEDLDIARAADGVILGPMSVNEYPPEAEGGRNVPAAFRSGLDLYANIRPSYTRTGLPSTSESMDLVFVRENLEDFYIDRNMFRGRGELMPTEDVAIAIGKITRQGSERIARAAFEVARRRVRRHVTIVHKAPVLRLYNGLFLDTARSVAADYPDVTYDDLMVDAAAAHLVRSPQRFDVVLTTNMFGDILSDLAAELSGSLGLAASLNHGDDHAVAQAGHGSAPDIQGLDVANPGSMLLSVAMLLDHLGTTKAEPRAIETARLVREAVDAQLGSPETRTRDVGGPLGTKAFAAAAAALVAAN